MKAMISDDTIALVATLLAIVAIYYLTTAPAPVL